MASPLHITQISLGDGYAGSHRFALLSSAELAKRGHAINLIANEGSLTARRARDLGLKTWTVPATPDRTESYSLVGDILDELKPGFVVAHHSLERKILMRMRLRHRAPFKSFAFRNIVSRSFPIVSAIPYNFLLDGQIACSHGVAKSLYRDGAFPWKVSLAYNGIQVPDPLPPPKARGDFGSGPNETLIGMSAWFHPKRKGFDLAFRALAQGLDRPFKLVLMGVQAEHQVEAKNFARSYGLDPQGLLFPGYVEDVWGMYQALDLFILPSREEGFSLSLLEAMACQLPCVVSDIPGNDEAIQHKKNGLKFQVSSFNQLQEAIQWLAKNPGEGRRMGEEARRTVLTRFTIGHSAESLENILGR